MGRIIPKNTKVKTQFFKNYTLTDGLVALVFIILLALDLLSDFSNTIKIVVGLAVLVLGLCMLMTVSPETRTYQVLGDMFRYIFGVKKFKKMGHATSKSVESLMPYVKINEQVNNEGDKFNEQRIGIIDYSEYYGVVFEIKPIQFYMLTLSRQNAYINAIDNAIKVLSPDQTAALYKFSRPMVLDSYIENEIQKRDEILENVKNGSTKPAEAKPRIEIVESRINSLDAMNVDKDFPIQKDHYYMAVFGKNVKALLSTIGFMVDSIQGNTNGIIECKVLNRKEVAVFLKNYYDSNFDEREVEKLDPKDYLEWICPDTISFSASKQVINGVTQTGYMLADYPVQVPNAWGRNFFSVPATKVCVKFVPVAQNEAEKRLDRAIMEMESQASKRGKASTMLEKDQHLETLNELLASIKTGNETLLDTSIFLTVEEENKKVLRTQLMRQGFRHADMFGRQIDCFISANVSKRNNIKRFDRGINSTSFAAMFPFVSDEIQDPKGVYFGVTETEPVFIDFFKRDKEHVNSNMVVMGKSGSGKSFCVKSILSHLASDNTKIFILDPEREYDILARNLNGKVVDVGSAKEGRINPLQVVTSLEDEDSSGTNVSLATHLQFLESFFKTILDGITNDALEVLNECIKLLYDKFNITDKTDINDLKPEQFPIMQDLYELVGEEYNKATDEYQRNNLKIIKVYLNKFAEGGRNSLLWNGYSTITADENFIVFNFQSLLANDNNDIANAQMMLIVRWLNNEIIKNKDFNAKFKINRKVVVVIDEAHVFIDPKKDVALDFMKNLAKRIRKYNGMQIVITQNIKDFVGTPEIALKSTAIINASQYSLIFSLAPQDITDLVALYEKAGQINEKEQDTIVSNARGSAFFISGPYSRTNISIVVNDRIRDLFEKLRVDAAPGKDVETEDKVPEHVDIEIKEKATVKKN